MTIKACLRILKLENAEDRDQVHRAYRQQVKRWHPDQFAHQPAIRAQAEERLKRINYAYSILKDYVGKTPSNHTDVKTSKKTHTQDEQKIDPQRYQAPSKWKQWFESNNPKHHQKDGQTKPPHCPKAKERASFIGNQTGFERLFRQASRNFFGSSLQKRNADHPLLHLRLNKQREKGMRIEGHQAFNPTTPIKRVSKINKI